MKGVQPKILENKPYGGHQTYKRHIFYTTDVKSKTQKEVGAAKAQKGQFWLFSDSQLGREPP